MKSETHMHSDTEGCCETRTGRLSPSVSLKHTLPLSVRTSARSLHQSHTDVPLGTSAGCGGAAPGAFSRVWRGVGGAALRAKQGPRAWMRASFVGHKALSVLGKATGMGTGPRAGVSVQLRGCECGRGRVCPHTETRWSVRVCGR